MHRRTVVVCLLLVLAFWGARGVRAQTEETLTLTATAGYDGYFKDGQWVPVHVAVANYGNAIEGKLEITTGSGPGDRVVYTSPVSLPTRSDKRLTLYVYLPGFTTALDLLLLDEDGDEVAAVEVPVRRLSQSALLYAVVSDEPVALDFLENVSGDRVEAVVAYVEPEALPDAAPSWRGIDVLIFSDVDSGRLTPAQRDALAAWVDTGGQLVVTGGSDWQQTAAAFSAALPVTPAGGARLDDLPGLRTQLGVPFRDPGPYLVTESELRSGELLLHEDGLPLLARVSEGRGAVYFLALDPNAPPLLDWAGSEGLWGMVAQRLPETPAWTQGPRNSYSAGQAVGSLSSLRLPPTLWLLLFIIFYVVAVGPVNYIVLQRLGRREWAWLSIPAIVLFFSVVAYLTGFRLRGNEVIVNQMAIAFGHIDGEQMQVSSLLGLYSPSRSSYDIHLPADVLVRPFDRNSGAMTGGGNLEAVERGSDTILRRVRVDVSGMETFVADTYRPLPAISGEATLHLDASGGELEVHVQNNSGIALENAGLLFGPLFTRLGDLEPGADRTERQRLTSRQAAAATGAGSSGGPYGYVGTAPLNAFYADLLGTSAFYNDPDVFPRFQLLESLNYYGGPAGPTNAASSQSSLLLLGWSEEPYLEVSLERPLGENPATTFYILELPVTGFTATGSGVEVPLEMLNWQVLDESGLSVVGVADFYMPYGWVEFEYEPWPLFQSMDVTSLTIVLQAQGPATGQVPPGISLWDWGQEAWVAVPDVVWGKMSIGGYASYLGPKNAVRIRLQNDAGDTSIRAVYPALSGNLE